MPGQWVFSKRRENVSLEMVPARTGTFGSRNLSPSSHNSQRASCTRSNSCSGQNLDIGISSAAFVVEEFYCTWKVECASRWLCDGRPRNTPRLTVRLSTSFMQSARRCFAGHREMILNGCFERTASLPRSLASLFGENLIPPPRTFPILHKASGSDVCDLTLLLDSLSYSGLKICIYLNINFESDLP